MKQQNAPDGDAEAYNVGFLGCVMMCPNDTDTKPASPMCHQGGEGEETQPAAWYEQRLTS